MDSDKIRRIRIVMRSLSLFILIISLSGCAHVLYIEKSAPSEKYVQAQTFLHPKPANLYLNTGKKFLVTDLHIGQDSTVFRIDGTTDRIVMMNDKIRSITTQDERKATIKGAKIGAVVGGVLGLAVGGLISSWDNSKDCETGPADYDYGSCGQDDDNDALIVLSSIGSGILVGALTGGVIGSQSGTYRTIMLNWDPKDARRWEYLPR